MNKKQMKIQKAVNKMLNQPNMYYCTKCHRQATAFYVELRICNLCGGTMVMIG